MGDVSTSDPANKYMLDKVNNKNKKNVWSITIKTQKQCQWRPLLLTLNIFHIFATVSIADYEQTNIC